MPVVKYEGAWLELSFNDPRDRRLMKRIAGQRVRAMLHKPLRNDGYLKVARDVLRSHPTAIVVDVGANQGATVLPLSNQFPQATFYAAEPHPIVAASFMRNRRRNPAGTVHFASVAVGLAGVAELHTDPSSNGGHRLSGFAGRYQTTERVTVAVVPLSDFAPERVDLLKIDTEGFEVAVLRSLGDRLHPSLVGTIVCEYGPEGLRSAGTSGDELLSLMHDAGYQAHDMNSGALVTAAPPLLDFQVTDWVFTGR